MSQDRLITMYSKESGEFLVSRVNRKTRNGYADKNFKLKLNKYSKLLRKVVEFFETKKIFKKK